MASTLQLSFSLILLLSIFTISSSIDMSIISYYREHITYSIRSNDEVKSLYESWIITHGKSYNAINEKENRFEIFKDNLRYIDEHNSVDRSYKLGLNRFADLTNEEYRSMFVGRRIDRETKTMNRRASDVYAFDLGKELPEAVDWREKGAVAPVKDQGKCGSSWAFATVGAVEGINQIVTGDMIVLSEQELCDCDRSYNAGCDGGLMYFAYLFIISNGGIDTEEDYPYRARDGTCDQYRKNAKVVSIDQFADVPEDELSLKKAVASQPVSVAIEAGGRDFQHYQSGVFTGTCGANLDYAAVAVGYGTENGTDYWIVRNSWGPRWGDNGYIKLHRNIADTTLGKCGIAVLASYPIKTGQNPPSPGPSPPSLYGKYCFGWGCCSLESATCCDDHSSCCPHDCPVCDLEADTYLMSKGNSMGTKALRRRHAKPKWTIMHGARKISSD